MVTKTKTPHRAGAYTIGRAGFARLSEVEGIKPNRELDEQLREFDRQGLSPEQRRRRLARKYGPAAQPIEYA